MGLNSTPAANRLHIGFFGCRNAGKSSLVNAVTGQDLAVVSDVKGTTTDPVSKTMELLPLGPVVIIDTPGFDDSGELGDKRVQKTKQILNKTDIAVLVVDSAAGLRPADRELLELFREKKVPYLVALNKSDQKPDQTENGLPEKNVISVSAVTGENIHELKERIAALKPQDGEKPLVSDLMPSGGLAVLVTPIDESAPKGRMILPQQQVLRDVLDHGGLALVVRETELEGALKALASPPDIVVTDSQAFRLVASIVPETVPLTSFSILMARYKGFLDAALEGIRAIDRLKQGDTVLIAEGCTHHRQCNDIGTVKIPRWLRQHCGSAVNIETCSGTEFPEDLRKYSVVIHCGGCMLNEREVQSRRDRALAQGVPFTNYGVTIAHITGILARSVAPILSR